MKMHLMKLSALLGALALFFVAKAKIDHNRFFVTETEKNEIKIMSYNVENLFDTFHEKGKNDFEYLPAKVNGEVNQEKRTGCAKVRSYYYRKKCFDTDWSEQKYQIKLNQIKRVLEAQGDLPDLIGLQEVENEKVVKDLAKTLGNKDLGSITTNGPDKRGVDVALIFNRKKLKLLDWNQSVVKIKKTKTRPILAAYFRILGVKKKRILGVYVNHWPSQGKKALARIAAAKTMMKEVSRAINKYGKQISLFAMGDFNTLETDRLHPFKTVLEAGDKDKGLYDLQGMILSFKRKDFKKYGVDRRAIERLIFRMPPGTIFTKLKYQNMVWNRYDRFFVSQNLTEKQSNVRVIWESFRILGLDFITKDFEVKKKKHRSYYFYGAKIPGVPFRYNFDAETPDEAGYSDHLPLVVKLRFK